MRHVAEKLGGTGAVITINIDDNRALASRFGIRSVPTILLLKNGQAVDRLPGAQSAEALLAWFRKQAH